MVVAIVAILVVGPKDLPKMLRAFGKTVGNFRRMAGDFQRQFDNAMREAELDEVRKTISKPFSPLEDARKAALDFQSSVNKSVSELEAQVEEPQKPVINMPPALGVTPAPAVVAGTTADLPKTPAKVAKIAAKKPVAMTKAGPAKPVSTKKKTTAKTGEKA